MAEEWAVHVRKYSPDADGAAIKGIVRHCGIARQRRDSALVSFSDKTETSRVREGFMKKKRALTDSDASPDAWLAEKHGKPDLLR